MTTYTCPTCMQSMDRDLLLFIKHTDIHMREAREAAAILRKRHRPFNRMKEVFRQATNASLERATV